MNKESQSIAALASLFFGAKLKCEIEHAGYVYLGSIGETGLLNHARESTPIAIFLDLGKEDIDFSHLVSTLRSDEKTASIPIVAFCEHVNSEKILEAEGWGCDVVTTNGAISAKFASVLHKAIST